MATKPKVRKLFLVTVKENGHGAERTVNVAADNFGDAARRAVKANPHSLWRPRAVKVELIGKVW